MLKKLAMLGLLITLAIPAIPQHNDPIGKGNPGQGRNDAQQPSPPPVPSITNNQTTAYYQQDGKEQPKGWHKLVTWPEGITAWLIMLTLGAIVWQAVETRRAVTAANRDTEIRKTKERAKFMVFPENLDPAVNTIPQVKITVTNVGESAAITTLALAGLHITDSDTFADPGAGYGQLNIGNSHVESGASSEETVWWPGNHFVRYSQAVIDGTEVVHLHGLIYFRDAFEDHWKYHFHFIWRQYGGEIWMAHLGETRVGEWDDKQQSQHRIEKWTPKKWWQIWRKAMPNPN